MVEENNQDSTIMDMAAQLQARIDEAYRKGYKEGRNEGLLEGLEATSAAVKQLLARKVMPKRKNLEKPIDPQTHVDELGLSQRVRNALVRSRINTVEDLSKKSREELLRVRNLGEIGAREIIVLMAENGHPLAEK